MITVRCIFTSGNYIDQEVYSLEQAAYEAEWDVRHLSNHDRSEIYENNRLVAIVRKKRSYNV